MRRAATSSAPTITDPAGKQQRAWHGKKNRAQLDDPFPGQGVFHGGLPDADPAEGAGARPIGRVSIGDELINALARFNYYAARYLDSRITDHAQCASPWAG